MGEDDIENLKKEFKSNPTRFIDHAESYIENSCPNTGGNYTSRACHDRASRLYAFYKMLRDTRDGDVIHNTITTKIREIMKDCGNHQCGDAAIGLDELIGYLRKEEKAAQAAQPAEVKQDGK